MRSSHVQVLHTFVILIDRIAHHACIQKTDSKFLEELSLRYILIMSVRHGLSIPSHLRPTKKFFLQAKTY